MNSMKYISLIPLIIFSFYIGGCNYSKVDDIKLHAKGVLEKSGFEIVGYQGYEIGNIFACPGGKVWYMFKQKDSPTIYNGCLVKWQNEYHLYDLKAINAISTQ